MNIRTESEAHHALQNSPVPENLRAAFARSNLKRREIEEHNRRAVIWRWLLLFAVGLWIGLGELVYFLFIRH